MKPLLKSYQPDDAAGGEGGALVSIFLISNLLEIWKFNIMGIGRATEDRSDQGFYEVLPHTHTLQMHKI